jgi:dihydrofolate reductase
LILRKIINSIYITLDAAGNPHPWPSLNGNDPDATSIQTELLASCDAVLMGRRTYEGFASVWRRRSGDDYSDRINSMRKYVASSTLRDPKWKNTASSSIVILLERPNGSRPNPERTLCSTGLATSRTK